MIETLESRLLLDALLQDHTLTIDGTGGDDQIGLSYLDYPLRYVVQIGTKTWQFRWSDVYRVTVLGRAGNDLIDLSQSVASPILVKSGAGNDTIHGGPGLDKIYAGDGDDLVTGALDNNGGQSTSEGSFLAYDDDWISGGAGNDTIDGAGGADTIYGDAGNDQIGGGVNVNAELPPATGENEFLFGGDGNDTLYGGDGNESLDGGAGNDILYGGYDNDTLNGGAGMDLLIGDEGLDTVDYSARTANLVLSIGRGYNDGEIGEKDNIATDIECLLAGAGNDSIIGSNSTDYLRGGGGNDTILGRGGTDFLNGEDGTDVLFGGDGDDWLDAGAGAGNSLYGEGGNDDLLAADNLARDLLDGGAGSDTGRFNKQKDVCRSIEKRNPKVVIHWPRSPWPLPF